jgi:16S rRNA (guanine966-N2)-methyltransferase
MRVVAGDLRGRRIEGPDGDATRPTTDKVREAVFNALGSIDAVDGAVVVDLFAGSGALGIEALSRGAARCTFVESDRRALGVLKGNIDALGIGDVSRVVPLDIVRDMVSAGALRLREELVDATLVLADPPYGFQHWNEIFSVVESAGPAAILVIETETRAAVHNEVPQGWKAVRRRDYGRTTVGFFVRDGVNADGS